MAIAKGVRKAYAAKNPGGGKLPKLTKPTPSNTRLSKGTNVTVAQVKATGYQPYQQAAKTRMKQVKRVYRKTMATNKRTQANMNTTARASAGKRAAGRM